VQYKLRDKTGQAREYFNYMQSLPIDGADVFLAGMREQPDQPFRYLRIPADDKTAWPSGCACAPPWPTALREEAPPLRPAGQQRARRLAGAARDCSSRRCAACPSSPVTARCPAISP
jgi:cytochrome c biogenesis protein ResB